MRREVFRAREEIRSGDDGIGHRGKEVGRKVKAAVWIVGPSEDDGQNEEIPCCDSARSEPVVYESEGVVGFIPSAFSEVHNEGE